MGTFGMLSGFEQRRALADWRDEWLFQVWRAMGAAAQQARADLEQDLPNAGLWNVYASQSAFAHPRVDRSMRRSLRPLFERVRALAAPSLHAIDPALRNVSLILRQTDLERLLPDELPDIPEPTTVQEPLSPAGTAVAMTVIGSAFTVGARLAFGPQMAIAMGVHTLANVASPAFRHWLLEAGSKRLSDVWIGGDHTGHTVTAKLSTVFDETCLGAKEVLQ